MGQYYSYLSKCGLICAGQRTLSLCSDEEKSLARRLLCTIASGWLRNTSLVRQSLMWYGFVSDRTCWCRLCSCDNSLSLPKRLSMYQVGFRFAPKLHGILTKAQAVLQLFIKMWANLCWSFIARKEIRKCWSNVLSHKGLVEMQYYYLG